MSRCKACNTRLSIKELYVDDELCFRCLATIRSSLNRERLKQFDDLSDVDLNTDDSPDL